MIKGRNVDERPRPQKRNVKISDTVELPTAHCRQKARRRTRYEKPIFKLLCLALRGVGAACVTGWKLTEKPRRRVSVKAFDRGGLPRVVSHPTPRAVGHRKRPQWNPRGPDPKTGGEGRGDSLIIPRHFSRFVKDYTWSRKSRARVHHDACCSKPRQGGGVFVHLNDPRCFNNDIFQEGQGQKDGGREGN